MHDSVYEMAGDDPRVAKLLRASLTKLADGPEGPLREMAEGALSGRVDLRQAAMSDAYGDELGSAFGRFWSHYEQLDQRERDEIVRQTEKQLDELLDGPGLDDPSLCAVRSIAAQQHQTATNGTKSALERPQRPA